MAKRGTYADVEVREIANKYLAGEKLTASELSILNMYAKSDPAIQQYLRQGIAARSTRSTAPRGQMNQYLASQNSAVGSRYRPSSPGGFKQSGMDADSDERMNAVVARARQGDNDPRRARIFRDGSAWVNGRMYGADRVRSAIRRGMSGASMSGVSAAIYDRYITVSMANAQIKEQQEIAARRAAAEQRAAEDEMLEKGPPRPSKLEEGWEYTREQRNEYNKLLQAYNEAGKREDIYPKTKRSFRLRLINQMKEIINSPVMTLDRKPTAQEEFESKLVRYNGQEYQIGNDGKAYLLPTAQSEFERAGREDQINAEKARDKEEKKKTEKRKEKEKRDREAEQLKREAHKELQNAFWGDVTRERERLMKDKIDDRGKEIPGLSYGDADAQAQESVKKSSRYASLFNVPVVEKEVLPVVERPIEEAPVVEQPIVEAPVAANANSWRDRLAARRAESALAQDAGAPTLGEQAAVCPACGKPLENGICYNENCSTNTQGGK